MFKEEFEIENNVLVKYHEKDGVTEVVIPDGITKIGEGAFAWSKSLTSITIPDSVVKIGQSAFFCCENLTSITIPNSVTKIGESAFSNCKSLTSITIPNSVIEIGNYAFYYCENLKNIIIPNSIIKIGVDTFSDCKNLTSITIPNSVMEIGDYAFYHCENLTSITIPNSVIGIGNYAFDSKYIEEINISTYDQFFQLNDYLKIITIESTLKNYYTGKIKYSDDDMNLFKEYIRKNKLEVFEYLKNNKQIIHIILNDMGNFLRKEDIDELLNKFDVEINGMLLEYINQNYNTESKNIKSIIDSEFDLGEFDDPNKKGKK